MTRDRATVVIPTMNREPEMLRDLVGLLVAHPWVLEVLIVNNADVDLWLPSGSVREIHRGENLYVNPSWNLGAASARGELLVLANDDIRVSSRFVSTALRLASGPVGIVGPHTSTQRRSRDGVAWALPAYERTPVFGTFMVMKRENYVEIPDDLKVFCGDDYLFHAQARRNLWFGGLANTTVMGRTSRDPQFDAIKAADVEAFNARHRYELAYLARYGREAATVNALRSTSRHLRGRPV